MGATDKTTRLDLSQFSDSDKPTFLGDYNGDMLKIDNGIIALDGDISNVSAAANAALGVAQGAASDVADLDTRVGTVETGVTGNATAISAVSDDLAAYKISNDTAVGNRFTKDESDDRYVIQPDKRPTAHAVFVGNSNSVVGTWPEILGGAENWNVHNYSVGGMGYTIGGATNNYRAQLGKAVADSTYQNSAVEYVFICDGANDARSKVSVATNAADCIQYARAQFPNARVIVIPVFCAIQNSPDTDQANKGYFLRVAAQQKLAAARYGAEYVDGSWTWHMDEPALVRTGEIHYTADGYQRIVDWVRTFLRGTDTWNHLGPQDLTVNAPWGNSTSGLPWLTARREGDTVYLEGTIKPPASGIANGNAPVVLPVGLRPGRDHVYLYTQSGAVTPRVLQISSANGNITFFGNTTDTGEVMISTSYSVL